MKYYEVSNSADTKTIGKEYPQCKGMPEGFGFTWQRWEQPNSMTNLNNDSFPDFEPDLLFEIKDTGKLTDVVSPSNLSATGILLNGKVRDILSKFSITEHRYYPAKVIFKQVVFEYYWMHFLETDLNMFNLDESVFYKTDYIERLESIKLNSLEEYRRIRREEIVRIFPEKVVFSKEYEHLHMFVMPYSNTIIANEDVVNTLSKVKIRGFKFNELK